MIIQLGDLLTVSLSFDELETIFWVEYKFLVVKFFLRGCVVSDNFDDKSPRRSPRWEREITEIRERSIIEDDFERLVDGSIYDFFPHDNNSESQKIVYFLSIIAYIYFCKKFRYDLLFSKNFKKCLSFFFLFDPNDLDVSTDNWPLFGCFDYQLSDRNSLLHKIYTTYSEDMIEFSYINGITVDEKFYKTKREIFFFYYDSILRYCEKKSLEYVATDMLDPFLFGLFKQLDPRLNNNYAIFNRYFSLMKNVEKRVRYPKTSIFEKRIYVFILSFLREYYESFHFNTALFLNNLIRENYRLQLDYSNGVLVTLLKLNYFSSTIQIPFDQKYLFLNIFFKTPINLTVDFSFFHWQEIYQFKIRNFLDKSDALGIPILDETYCYDQKTIVLIKSKITDFIETSKLSSASSTYLKNIVNISENEFSLLETIFNAIKKNNTKKEKKLLLIIFFSVIVFLRDIFAVKLNNSYVLCINRYRSHQSWFHQIYEVDNLSDPNYRSHKKDLISHYDAAFFSPGESSSKENLHFKFQTCLTIYFILQEYYYNLFKKIRIRIEDIWEMRLIDFDDFKSQMTFSIQIYLLFNEIRNLTPRKKNIKKIKKTTLNLSQLLNNNFDSYFYYKSKTKVSNPLIEEKRILRLKKKLKKLRKN